MSIRFLVYNIFGMGGTVRTVNNMATALVQKGHDVEIISVMRSADKPLFELDDKIKITSLYDSRREKDLKYIGTAEEKKIVSKKSKIIHPEEDLYNNFNLYIDQKLMDKLKSLRDGVLITTIPSFNMLSAKYVHPSVIKIGQEHKGLQDHPRGIVKMIKDTYSKLDVLTILTKKNYQLYRELIPNKDLPIVVLGNGTERLYTLSPLKNKVIISAGRYVEQKGFDLLIESFAKIAKDYPDWKVKIFGSGGLKEDLYQQIVENKVENQVLLCPTTDELLKEISKSAFYVCSSKYEPFGMILIEAMSVGVPILSYECEGPLEIITEGVEGLLVPELDVDGLAEKMKILMDDYELRRRLGRNAQLASEKYSMNSIALMIESIIETAMNNRKK